QGSNLANFGDRDLIAGYLEHDKENLVDWISDPESLKPGNKMAGAYDLSVEEIDKVAEDLMELSVGQGSGDVSALKENAEERSDEGSSEEESSEEGGN